MYILYYVYSISKNIKITINILISVSHELFRLNDLGYAFQTFDDQHLIVITDFMNTINVREVRKTPISCNNDCSEKN